MTGMDRPTRVTLDGLSLNTEDDPNIAWRFTKADGWDEGASVLVDQQQRLTSHGQFATKGRRGGRLVTITGRLEARTRDAIPPALERLQALLADGQFGRLEIVDRTAGARRALVQLVATPSVSWNGGPTAFYQLQLLAPDPYRYGATSTSTTGFLTQPAGIGAVWPAFPDGVWSWGTAAGVSDGIARVANVGNAPAVPRISVTGPAPAGGFTITQIGTGRELTYLGDLPAGSTLAISSRDGTAILDGVADRTSSLLVTRWPEIGPRTTGEFLFQSLGTSTPAQLTVAVDATYW